jgi:hypothetical protein
LCKDNPGFEAINPMVRLLMARPRAQDIIGFKHLDLEASSGNSDQKCVFFIGVVMVGNELDTSDTFP